MAGTITARRAPARGGDGSSAAPPAVVMGDADLLWPLTDAGIPCVLFTPEGNPARWSRRATARLPWIDAWERPEAVVDMLLEFAAGQPAPPVLMPQRDPDLLTISRHRERLGAAFRFVLPEPALVEALVDKTAFMALAARLDLPVPRAQRLTPHPDSIDAVALRYPVILKPALRQDDDWHAADLDGKAMHAGSRRELEAVWPRIVAGGLEVIAQEAIPGSERRIESYHAYFDAEGRHVAGFTGRKIRTRPLQYGYSTSVEITDAPDVADLGREVLERMSFTGVAKLDFKRDPEGRLHLLEVNPRFTLWHHPAAVAGMNVPALVYADLTGRPRPGVRPPRAGVTWCKPPTDVLAARAEGGSLVDWARFAFGCDAVYAASRRDPLPLFPGWVWAAVRPRVMRAAGRDGTG